MAIRVTRSVIPSLFTTMNLFCGFFAIVKSAEGGFRMAAWLIVLGGIFDALDGAMARLTKSSSEFGVELDSLADVVTFGAAPSFLLYAAFFHQWETAGVVISALPAICGSLRLARFNVQLVGFDKDYFSGCPIPTGAITLISYLIFIHLPDTSFPPASAKPALLAIITVVVSALMISTIRYDSLPKLTKKGLASAPVKTVGFLLALIAVAVTKGAAIFPVMAIYLLYGIVRQILVYFSRPEEIDEPIVGEVEDTGFDV